MYLDRRVRLQLLFFSIVTLVTGWFMVFSYLNLPNLLFGVGHYRVSVELPVAGGLYKNANVTYRGVEVGRVAAVGLTPSGVNAVLSLESSTKIPADLVAQVHSQTAVGEQFVELVPRSGNGPALKNGDVIPVERTTVPPDINAVLSATNEGLQAIPHDDLKTAIDESYTAVGGLGPELARVVDGTTKLAADARQNLDSLTTLIDQSKPILDTQVDTSDSIQSWAASLAQVTKQVQDQDPAFKGLLNNGPGAANEVNALLTRLQPTLPILLSNLVSLDKVGITYQPSIEQLLVLLPPDVEMLQGSGLANRTVKPAYKGLNLSFNLNANLPPPCTTGYLPPQQMRAPSAVDYPDRPKGDLYCRVPQDSPIDVRGVRNLPCMEEPGKRAPTVKMCESNENYIPLNDGTSWKGDPNATLSGQPVPALPADGSAPVSPTAAMAPVATAVYDPTTGTYIGPDGKRYTQADLAPNGAPKTWRDLLVPPVPK